MNRFTLSPASWPIWFKIAAGIVLTIITFVLPASVVQQQRLRDLALARSDAFITENGARQANLLTNALEAGQRTIDDFVADEDTLVQLYSFFVGNIQSNIELDLQRVEAIAIENLLQNRLLNAATTPYESIRLIAANGQVRARVQVGGRAAGGLSDESNSPTFRAIQSAELRGLDRTLNITVENFPILDYVVAVRWRDGRTLGYVAARFSNARILFANLRYATDELPAYSALVTQQNDIIAPVDTQQDFVVSINEDIVARAFIGESGVTQYQTESGENVLGFYSRLGTVPLVLIAQTPIAATFTLTQQLYLAPALVSLLGGVIMGGFVALVLTILIARPLARMRRTAQRVAEGEFDVQFPDAQRGDEIGALAATLDTVRGVFQKRVMELDNRVLSRGRDIAATQEISRYAATQRDLQLLMDRVVELIVQRFPVLYHAQIFLIDEEGRYAVVRASTGEVGKQLMARGHRLAVGSVSVIGQVTDQARTIIARDTSASQVHRRNEFLPDTRAELAAPLAIGDRIIGALDVQSKERDAFSEDLVTVLQTMADQLAVAIENARLYQESLRRVAEIEAANRLSTLAAWQDYMRVLRSKGVQRDAGIADSQPAIVAAVSALRHQAMTSGQTAIGQPTPRSTIPVAIPITLRGEMLGAVEWELPMQSFSEDKLELARELAGRLAVSMDNARLFQDSQRNAERERLVSTIAARLTAQTSIDTILQTAVREVGQALRVPNVSIRLRSLGSPDPAAADVNGKG